MTPRNRQVSNCVGTLKAIRQFVIPGGFDDPLHGRVCGLLSLPDGIAIEVH
jgi:hypothetical protein